MDASEIISLIIIGLIAGAAAVWAMQRFRPRKKSKRWTLYAVVGILGAMVGQFLFSLLGADIQIFSITLELGDVIIAFIGAIILLFVVDYFKL